jgi:SAM-dependent methyltransferase
MQDASRTSVIDLIPLRSGGTVIEIGPADGYVLSGLLSRGYERAVGIERDATLCAHMAANGIEPIETDDPVEGVREAPEADTIAMFHLIEHVPKPMELLDACAEKLRPGGSLVLSTPNPRSLSMHVCGGQWRHVEAPRHLFLLPLGVIKARLGRHGLELTGTTTTDPVGLLLNSVAWDRWEPIARMPRVNYRIRRVMRFGAQLIERRGMLGSTYTATFTR